MKKTKILYIIDNLRVGGAQTILFSQIKEFVKRGYEVTLACLGERGRDTKVFEDLGIEVCALEMRGFLDAPRLFRLFSLIRREKPDIVQTYAFYSNTLGVLVAKLAAARCVVSSVEGIDLWMKWPHFLLNRLIFFLVNRVIVRSSTLFNVAKNRMVCDSKKIELIYNGIRVDDFEVKHWRRTTKVVGTVASLTPIKGHRFLIEAAKNIIEEYPDVRFVFVGDGSLGKDLKKQVASLGLEENFVFLGDVGEVGDVLSGFSVFVLPSISEGHPVSILEAMASGLPVVASNVGGIPEIVEDGVSGFLVPPKNPEKLASAINRLLGDRRLSKKIGLRGREIVEEKFTLEGTIQETEEVYRSLVNSP